MFCGKAQDRPTATDLDVVGVRSKCEDSPRPIGIREQSNALHGSVLLQGARNGA